MSETTTNGISVQSIREAREAVSKCFDIINRAGDCFSFEISTGNSGNMYLDMYKPETGLLRLHYDDLDRLEAELDSLLSRGRWIGSKPDLKKQLEDRTKTIVRKTKEIEELEAENNDTRKQLETFREQGTDKKEPNTDGG